MQKGPLRDNFASMCNVHLSHEIVQALACQQLQVGQQTVTAEGSHSSFSTKWILLGLCGRLHKSM
jgi:hypothetical protein